MALIPALIDFWLFLNTLVQNPDVESNILGWTGNACTITQDAANALSGSFSVKVVTTNATSSGPFLSNTNATKFAAVAGSSYASVFYIFATGSAVGTSHNIRIEWYNNVPALISASTQTVTLVAGWNRFVLIATAPGTTVTATPTFYTNGAQGILTYWTDMPYFGLASNFLTLQDPTPAPGNRFVNWTPDTNRIVDREVPVGTGLVSEFLYRRDAVASFEVQHLTPTQLATAYALKDALLGNSGFAIVVTADNNNAIYCMALAPGTDIKPKLVDKGLFEYSLALTLKNLAYYNSASGTTTPIPTVDYR